MQIFPMAIERGNADQFGLRTLCGNLAVLQDQDLIDALECGKPCGQEDHGSVFSETLISIVEKLLRIIIESGRRFFDNDQGRVSQCSPS